MKRCTLSCNALVGEEDRWVIFHKIRVNLQKNYQHGSRAVGQYGIAK